MAQGALQARLQLATGAMLNQVEGNINLDLERSLPPFLYDVEFYQSRESAHPELVDCMLGRTNVKYILRPKRADTAATQWIGDVFNGSPTPSALYEDLCFVPRAYVAGNSLFSTDSAETLDHLASRDFDALNTVILAASAGASPVVGVRVLPCPQRLGGASARRACGNRASRSRLRHASGRTRAPRLRRPAGSIRPQLGSTLDGRPAAVLRANQIFRAVYAGAGLTKSALNITSAVCVWG